jgi:flagellar protein FliS
MFQQTKAWQSYRQVATQTASPGQLVLLLYDGILRFLEQARLGFSKDDPKEFNETINNNIQRAQAIINEMNQSLNMTLSKEFTVRLRALYDYFDRRLHESNMTKTSPGIEEVLKHVRVLRDAWAEMLQRGTPPQPSLTAHPVAPPSAASGSPGSLQP